MSSCFTETIITAAVSSVATSIVWFLAGLLLPWVRQCISNKNSNNSDLEIQLADRIHSGPAGAKRRLQPVSSNTIHFSDKSNDNIDYNFSDNDIHHDDDINDNKGEDTNDHDNDDNNDYKVQNDINVVSSLSNNNIGHIPFWTKLCIIIIGDNDIIKEGKLGLNVNISYEFLRKRYCVALLITNNGNINEKLIKDIKNLFLSKYHNYIFPINCNLESKDSIDNAFDIISNNLVAQNKKIPVAMIYNPIYRSDTLDDRNVTNPDIFEAATRYYKIGCSGFLYCIQQFLDIKCDINVTRNIILSGDLVSNGDLCQQVCNENIILFASIKSAQSQIIRGFMSDLITIEDEYEFNINFVEVKHRKQLLGIKSIRMTLLDVRGSFYFQGLSHDTGINDKLNLHYAKVKNGLKVHNKNINKLKTVSNKNDYKDDESDDETDNLTELDDLEEYTYVHIKWEDTNDNDRAYYIVAHKRNETSAFYQLQLRDNDEMEDGKYNAWILGRALIASNYVIGFQLETPLPVDIFRWTRVESSGSTSTGFVFCASDSIGTDNRGNTRWRLMPSADPNSFGKDQIRSRIRNNLGIPTWMAINRDSQPEMTIKTINSPDTDFALFTVEETPISIE